MSRHTFFNVHVAFGDCDPLGIVFFPNYLRWIDAASLDFFAQCGLPPWRELIQTRGILGTPMLEINTQYRATATYGDTLRIETWVHEWRNKVFLQKHLVRRDDTVLCECLATRAFVIHPPEAPERIKTIPIPPDIQALCSQPEEDKRP